MRSKPVLQFVYNDGCILGVAQSPLNESKKNVRRECLFLFLVIFLFRVLCDCKVIDASGHFCVTSWHTWHTRAAVEYARQLSICPDCKSRDYLPNRLFDVASVFQPPLNVLFFAIQDSLSSLQTPSFFLSFCDCVDPRTSSPLLLTKAHDETQPRHVERSTI